jgi:hypothetical protein
VNVVKPVSRTRVVSSHCLILIGVLYFNERKKKRCSV